MVTIEIDPEYLRKAINDQISTAKRNASRGTPLMREIMLKEQEVWSRALASMKLANTAPIDTSGSNEQKKLRS